jgi:3-hydroxyacyl-CoA dehydrogenase
MAIGPLHLLDEIGLDTALAGGMVLAKALGQRMAAGPLLVAMIKANRLGRKSGAGFFQYDDAFDGNRDGSNISGAAGENATAPLGPDPQLARIIDTWSCRPAAPRGGNITFRLLLPMLLEACRMMEERKVSNPRSIDLGVVFGLGFPSCGLLRWADELGPRRLLAELGRLEPLGERFRPAPRLLEMARRGQRFYGQRRRKPTLGD